MQLIDSQRTIFRTRHFNFFVRSRRSLDLFFRVAHGISPPFCAAAVLRFLSCTHRTGAAGRGELPRLGVASQVDCGHSHARGSGRPHLGEAQLDRKHTRHGGGEEMDVDWKACPGLAVLMGCVVRKYRRLSVSLCFSPSQRCRRKQRQGQRWQRRHQPRPAT